MFALQHFCVARDGRPVVQDACLRVASPGLLFIVGAGGAGKSSLLMALSGAGAEAGIRHTGTSELDGIDIALLRCTWISQHARLDGHMPLRDKLRDLLGLLPNELRGWLQVHGLDAAESMFDTPCAALTRAWRRVLAVLAGLHVETPLVLVDEPGADLDDAHALSVRRRLHVLAQRCLLVVATHNRQECLALGGTTALLAGGTIQECAPTQRFFSAPVSEAARIYVETGNCNLPAAEPAGHTRDGIWWVVPGLLCGMSRPGLMAEAERQYRRLAEDGVRRLVCLEERCEYPLAPTRAHGIAHLHVPVADMTPPSFSQAVDLCRTLEYPIRNNEGVALHCRGGLGRTGTALALLLVWFGDAADVAIAKVRRANPQAIQSAAQQRFLHEFADRIRGWHDRSNNPEESIACR